jgi:hypothetical protein
MGLETDNDKPVDVVDARTNRYKSASCKQIDRKRTVAMGCGN